MGFAVALCVYRLFGGINRNHPLLSFNHLDFIFNLFVIRSKCSRNRDARMLSSTRCCVHMKPRIPVRLTFHLRVVALFLQNM